MKKILVQDYLSTDNSNWDGEESSYGFCAEIVKTFLDYDWYTQVVFVNRLKYEHMNSLEYMEKVTSYINELGFDVELLGLKPEYDEEYAKSVDGYVFKINTNVSNGDIILGSHSLVRMIYSNRFVDIWDKVFELRELGELKDLDKWEIMQLALYSNGENMCHDYSNSLVSRCNSIHKITTLKKFKQRMLISGINGLDKRATYYFTENVDDIRENVLSLIKDGKYLEVYNMMKSTDADFTSAKCIDDSNAEDSLTYNKIYLKKKDINNKRVILIVDDSGNEKRYNKKRFNLI